MSGESRSGTFQGNKYEVVRVLGTNYQLRNASFETIIPNTLSEKVLTDNQLKKEINKGYDLVSDYNSKHDKYTIYQLAVGVIAFGKYKPKFIKPLTVSRYRAKGNEKFYGYVIYDNKNKELTVFSTLAKAKARAIELLNINYEKICFYTIKKVYKDNFGRDTKHITVGKVILEKVGEMKSRPKKQPKSFLVLPLYQYVYTGCLSDHELEYL